MNPGEARAARLDWSARSLDAYLSALADIASKDRQAAGLVEEKVSRALTSLAMRSIARIAPAHPSGAAGAPESPAYSATAAVEASPQDDAPFGENTAVGQILRTFVLLSRIWEPLCCQWRYRFRYFT